MRRPGRPPRCCSSTGSGRTKGSGRCGAGCCPHCSLRTGGGAWLCTGTQYNWVDESGSAPSPYVYLQKNIGFFLGPHQIAADGWFPATHIAIRKIGIPGLFQFVTTHTVAIGIEYDDYGDVEIAALCVRSAFYDIDVVAGDHWTV